MNEGVVPREALQPLIEPLYSAQERALMAAVAAGQVPEAALEDESFLIKSLVNQGLVPRETVTS